MAKINTILQCFVDLNLELDENAFYSSDLPEVSFAQRQYNVDEGQIVEIDINLEEPSISGLEEVEIGLVVNNTSVSDFDTLGETYPQVLTFSAGQQTNTIRFLANTDLVEELAESFDVILGFFTNCKPGTFITTTVNIVDLTNLKEVFINDQGGVFVPGQDGEPDRVDLDVFEGAGRNIKISLDSPSVLGIESVDIQLTNVSTSSNDYAGAIMSTNFSWAPGEQDKILTVQTNQDQEIEQDEILQIQLINPVNVNIDSPSVANVKIIDGSPEPLYTQINLQDSYIQLGGINAPTIEGRWVEINVDEGIYEPIQNERRFLKFGQPLQESYTKFNQPNGSAQGYGFDAASNIVVGYDENLFGNLQHTNVIFFGEKPQVNFGPGSSWSINPNGTKEYGDLRLRITNQGSHPSIISGQTVSVGGSITLDVDRSDFRVLLPTNAGLLVGGSNFNGNILSQDTLTQCSYEFVFEVDFEELGFQLRNLDNSVSSNKEINLGTHVFTNVYTEANAVLPQNENNLVTQINSSWPYWETNYSFPETGPYCLPSETLGNQYIIYPTDNTDLQNCIYDGMLFLHQDSTTFNNTSPYKSDYQNIYFLPSGQTASLSGCTGRDIDYRDTLLNNAPYTSSIPFFVLGQ